jgi:predicted dehydrogenase
MGMIKAGIIGCGNISGIYLQNLTRLFRNVTLAGCADLVMEKAREKAAAHGIVAMTVEEMLADPDIGIIVNLTIPKAHAAVTLAALDAGKHVYLEKPFAITRADGQAMLARAREKGLRIGCAPDTFLGGGIQTARKLLDDGWIGKPVGATAFMTCHGHEGWHPDPEFYYETGGGPLFDMGPYYLTALVNLLGPVASVTGHADVTFPTRTITSEPKFGKVIPVEVPTHVTGLLRFADGQSATLMTSFDVWHSKLPRIELYGSEGTLLVPDPNTFGGPVLLRRMGQADWSGIPLSHGYSENSRGIGVADMAQAIAAGTPHRADMTLAYHVLDVMHAIHDAAREERVVRVESTCGRPEALCATAGFMP